MERERAMISAVILDWSGVVSSDWEATFKTSNEVLQFWGHRALSMAEFRELYELPWANFYKKLGVKIDMEKEYGLWEQLFPKYYSTVKPFPFAKGTLEWLKRRGIKTIVLSAHNQPLLEKEVADYGFQGLIDFVDGSNEDKRKKIGVLVARHEIERETTLYVGDMVHDIETAKQAGIRSVAVLSGYDKKEKLEKAKPDFIIKDLSELPALIRKLEGAAHE